MELLFPMASRIFLQTHIWPMILREGHIREVRLQLLVPGGTQVPVFVNCQKYSHDGVELFTWVLFVTVERSRYEHDLLELKRRAEDAATELTQSERFIRTITDALPSAIAYWGTDLLCQFVNKTYAQWFGKHPREMVGSSMAMVLGEPLFEKNYPVVKRALAGEFLEFEQTFNGVDGSVSYALVDYIPDQDATGTVKGFFALVTNITRLREADTAIRLSASVFDVTSEGIMVTDPSGTIISVNPAFTSLTGYSQEEGVGRNARILQSGRHEAAFFGAMFQKIKADGRWKGEIWNARKDGSIHLVQLSISTICDEGGQVVRYVGVFSDITEKWDREQLVLHMALHDGLTGLPNRTLLMERLGQLIALSHREPRQVALMFLDLDGFKKVNDTLGHAIGDEVLKTVAKRLSGLIRNSDTVARLGGDEFVLLLDNPQSNEDIALIGARVIAVVNEPIELHEHVAQVGVSIGIALFNNGSDSPEALVQKADAAMYAAKTAGKNGYRFAE